MSVVLLATLGFDERHVIRSLVAMGMGGIGKIILLVPSWDMDSRTKKAIREIMNIAGLAGIGEDKIVVSKIDVENFWLAVSQIVEIFRREIIAGNNKYKLSLGGGLRALIIEAYTASLLIRNGSAKIDIRIDIEGKDKPIEISPQDIPLCETPSKLELEIIEKITENPETTITQLSKQLGKPKSTIWKTIKKLQDKNLLAKINNKYTTTHRAKALLTLLKNKTTKTSKDD